MPVSEMLQRVGSSEINEWIAELLLRAADEKEASDKARRGEPQVMGG